MSLINQVLRDLHSRQVCPPVSGLQAQIRAVTPGKNRLSSGYLLPAVILLLVLCLGIYLLERQKSAQIEAVAHQPLVARSQEPLAATSGFSGAHLAAVRLLGTNESSRLLLEFSKPLRESATVLFSDRQMTVLLPEMVTPLQQLPQPEAKNDLVRSMNLVQVDHLWQLQVHFSSDVRIDRLFLEADALHGERLAFDIYSQPVEVEKEAQLPLDLTSPRAREKQDLKSKDSNAVKKQARTLSPEERAEDFYLRGVKAAKGQRLQESLQYWQQALRVQPQHLPARKQLILAQLVTNRGLVDGLFAEGLILHDPLALRKWYARALLPVFGAAQAVAVLGGQEIGVIQDTEYRALQAGLWQQAGDYSRSRQAYLDLLQEFPAKGLYLFGLAVAHDQLDDPAMALETYQKALDTDLETDLKRYSRKRIEALALNRGAGN